MSDTPRTDAFYIGKARTLPDGKGVAIDTPKFQECREHAAKLECENAELRKLLSDTACPPTTNNTMNELFDIPEQKSPRLLWLERHGIKTTRGEHYDEFEDKFFEWVAFIPDVDSEFGDTEDDALGKLCKNNGIKTWNEEGA